MADKESVLLSLAGASVGAGIYNTVGGIGLVGSFGGIGLGLAPMAVVGGVVGMAGYGLYNAIAEPDLTAVAAVGLGSLGGVIISSSIGGMGLSMGGAAFGVGMSSMAVAGGIFGLGIYGLAKMIDSGVRKETFAETYSRMESKISHQEFYYEALFELDPQLSEWMLIQRINDLEVESELATLKTQISGIFPQKKQQKIKTIKKEPDEIPESVWQQLEIELEVEAIKARIFG